MPDCQASAKKNHVPVVIVKSEGNVSAETIITNIRKVPISENHLQLDVPDVVGLKYEVVTKYYNTDIVFVPFDQPLDTLPSELLSSVEGLLIYFDADKRDSLAVIKAHLEYLESNQIGLVLLLCDQLFDDERLGITYTEVKQSTRLMDVIELGRQKEEHDDDECEDHYDPIGYDEVLQVLQNFIWSHVDMLQMTGNAVGGFSGMLGADLNGGDEEVSGEDLSTMDKKPNSSGAHDFDGDNEEDEEAIEAELAGFEKLLTDLMVFKSNAATLSQTDRLAYTQGFADAFDDIIGEGHDSSDEELPASIVKPA